MAQPNIKTIRASSHPLGTGDFTTIQAWEDWADDKTNPYQWAECYQGFNLGTFTVSGWSSTPTSSGYPRIYAASGEQHLGEFTKGPIIAPGETSAVNTIGVNYSRVEGIGSTRGFSINLDTASNVLVEKCWAFSKEGICFKAKSDVSATSSSGNLFRNCVALGTDGHDIGFELGGENMFGGKPNVQCYNCTAHGNKNVNYRIYNTSLPGFYGGADITIQNCIGTDATGKDFALVSGGNGKTYFSYNLSTDNTAISVSGEGPVNWVTSTSGVASDEVFVRPFGHISTSGNALGGVDVFASGDFRLKQRSAAIDRGGWTSYVRDDIKGLRRPDRHSQGKYGSYDLNSGKKEHYPHAISGYYPLYDSPTEIYSIYDDDGDEESYAPYHTHIINGVTYYMSDELTEGFSRWHGTYPHPDTSGLRFHQRGPGFKQVYDVGAYEHGFYNNPSGVPMFVRGPLPHSSGTPLMLCAAWTASGVAPLYMEGALNASGTVPLYIGALTPASGQMSLIIGAQGPNRHAPLFVRAAPTGIGGISSLGSDFSGSLSTQRSPLYIKSFFTPTSGVAELNIQGWSTITTANSWLYYRDINVDSDNYIPTSRKSNLFIESEKNCLDGSLYKFDNNVNDNSSDYGFKLYASGYYAGGGGTDVTPMLESGFYQTSGRFSGSSATGSGVARFIGGSSAGIKMITNSTYYGTILTQSGSPSIHDQHRITEDRRGVATSFWINKKKGRYLSPNLKAVQGVMGNLELNNTRYAASGQWGIYYVPTIVRPSGTTPFNSMLGLLKTDSEGRPVPDTKTFGGIIPIVNTTAGGKMGRLLRTDSDGQLVQEALPDTMIPLDEDRWYYMQFWIDTIENSSYIRIASPPKGIPGQSGYRSEIKPITDKCQQWGGHKVKTDADNLKFKIGGNLYREQVLPYYNLGYNTSASVSQQEEFLIDEVALSNDVCSIAAMEEKFDTDYSNYIGQFSSNASPSLFISGE